MLKSAVKVFFVVALFGAAHSLLASRGAKETAARIAGGQARGGLYRLFYIGQSFVSLAGAWALIRPLPDRVLYDLRGLPGTLMRLVQASGLAYATWAAYEVGLARITGIRPGLEWLAGKRPVRPEPEAQGPRLEGTAMRARGPFRFHRHPLNFAPLIVFWFNPIMKVKLLAFSLAASLYLYAGSFHEEWRLEAAYGQPYRDYQASGVPFYFP